MGQPGQGITHHKIIDRPEIKSWPRRITEAAMTVLLWVVWLYWITPILILLLWLAGIASPAQRLFTRGTFAQLHAVLVTSGLAFLLILLSEFLWIGYNRLVHGRKVGRRQRVPGITYRHLYESSGMKKQTVEQAQKLRRLKVTVADGKLEVTNLDEPADLRRRPPARRRKREKVAAMDIGAPVPEE